MSFLTFVLPQAGHTKLLLILALLVATLEVPGHHGVAVVGVPNNGVAGNVPSVALPAAAEDGTVIVVGTDDPDGAQITGASGGPHTITVNNSRSFTRILGAWRSEF